MRKFVLLLICAVMAMGASYAQGRTVTGKVTDNSGAPLVGATVSAVGGGASVTTNADGNFTINVRANTRQLQVTYVGYASQNIALGTRTSYTVSLAASAGSLADVVVATVQVPYGTIKKTAFTGSEATVTSRNLEKQQVTSVTKALEGLIPGIITTNGGGAPGSNASVFVRGIGSYLSSSSPLYVLDGIPYDGSLSSLNMDEIESVTVLKDATASSLYGSRAANGVIMLTTKKGQRGRSNISAKVTQGYMSRLVPEYDRIGPKDYYEVMWEATRNGYLYGASAASYNATTAGAQASQVLTDASHLVYNAYNVPGNQLVDPTTGKLNPNASLLWNESWEDALYRTASRKNADINISGGGDKSDYFLSIGYVNEEGIVKFSGLKRYNVRLNLNVNPTTWFKAGMSIDGALSQRQDVPSGGTATTNPFYYTRNMGPIYPVYQHDAQGKFIIDPSTGQPQLDWGVPTQMGTRPYAGNSNLLGSLALDDRNSKYFNGDANTYAEATFLKNFSFRTTLGANYYNSYNTTYQNAQYGDAQNVRGRSTKGTEVLSSYTLNEVLSWNKVFGEHNLRVLAGHENYQYRDANESATRIGFPFPGTTELNTAATGESSGSYTNNLTIESYFSSLNYQFKNRYLLSASYRTDGTSRFAPDKRWGSFYSAGLGWRISQENFLKDVKWINELKLKASYGETGNQSIPTYYAYQYLYDLGYNNVDNPGAVVGAPPNPDLQWEKNDQLNIGVDFSLFKSRLQGTIEWFNRASKDLLFGVPLAASTGNSPSTINQNIGALTNRGVELQLGFQAVRSKNFDWGLNLNLTHFTNKFTKLPPGQTEIISGTKKIMVGRSIEDFWIKEYAGVDPATGDALYYKDVLGSDGKATGQRVLTNNSSTASFYYEGSAIPDLSGGLVNDFRYKDFTLSFLVSFSYGGKFYDQNFQTIMSASGYGTALATEILQRWQKPGDITNVPRIQNGIANQDATSTRWLFDASWLNLKNVTLSYNIPRSLLRNIGIGGISIFGNVDNAFLLTAHKGMDPQRAITGTSDWSYTPFRTVSFGLNLKL